MITILTIPASIFVAILLPAEMAITAMGFFFGSDSSQNHCDRLELERCFEAAFQTMRIKRDFNRNQTRSPETSRIRHRRSMASVTHVMMPRNQHLCAANQHYLSCFSNDGCQDDYAAHIASTVFNQIHGRFLPIQMFLAHKGYILRVREPLFFKIKF
uniref:Uncharacterized protein n=1 Tax=Setaria digitata TaxID=48799 RepID=A0A915PQM9_9BILA